MTGYEGGYGAALARTSAWLHADDARRATRRAIAAEAAIARARSLLAGALGVPDLPDDVRDRLRQALRLLDDALDADGVRAKEV